jgi:transketolase
MIALKKTEDNLRNNSTIDASIVEITENEAEVFAAFEAKSKDFKHVQEDFMQYMDRLKQDIDRRAEKFEYIEYYDASLRDTTFKNYAVASARVNQLDTRRMSLAIVNPLFAETAELPPPPSIEDITNEHMTINLPKIAKAALEELSSNGNSNS